MSISDDFIKKHSGKSPNSQKNNQQAEKPAGTSAADVFINKYGGQGTGGTGQNNRTKDTGSMQSWATSSIDLIEDTHYRSRDWFDDNEYKSRSDRIDSLISQAGNWRNQYKSNRDAVAYIDAVVDALSEAKTNAGIAREYYSQWQTADDYNGYLVLQKEYEGKKNFDLEAGRKEIEALERKKAELERSRMKPSNGYLTGTSSVGATPYGAMFQGDYAGDSELAELDDLISQKKQYLNQAKHIQDGIAMGGVINNDDFRDHIGYVSTKAEGIWDNMTSQFGMGYNDLTYEYINGKRNGMRQEIINKAVAYDADTEVFFSYDHMTDDQIATYNYHYAKDGKEAAEKYLDSIREALHYQAASERFGKMEGHTALELLFGIEAGVNQFQSGMKNLINTGDDYIPQTATQMASGMVREDLADDGFKILGNSVGQVAYDAITTTANMAPSILTSVAIGFINPVAGQMVGSAMMGASAAGNAYQEALNQGFDKDQARGYGLLVGASEVVMEKVLGGISDLGGNALGKFLTQNVTNADTALKMIAKKLGASALSEFSEEYLQEVLTPVFSNLMLGTDKEVKFFSAEALYSGLLGALTAGIMEGPSTISGEVNTHRTGKQLQNAGVSADRLAEIGKTFSADTAAYRLADKVNEKTGAYTIGRLFNEIGAGMSEQNVADITSALVAENMPEDIARKNAEIMAHIVAGGEVSDIQMRMIEKNDILAKVMREVIIDPNSAPNQRTGGYNEYLTALKNDSGDPAANGISAEEYSRMVEAAQMPLEAEETTGEQVDAEAPKAAQAAQAEPVTAREAPAATVSEKENVPANDRQMTGKLTGKESLQAAEESSVVAYRNTATDAAPATKGVPVTIEEASRKYGAQAGAMLHTYKPGQDVAQFDAAYRVAYNMGKSGVNIDYALKSPSTAYLTEGQRGLAYAAGEAAANTAARARQTEIQEAANGKTGHRKGGLVRGEGVTIADLKKAVGDSRGTAYKTLSTIAKVTGIDIVLYKSEADSSGTFRDVQGKYRRSEPGTIYIDINAGLSHINDVNDLDKYTTLRTFGHEFTHFIENWNPAHYNEFRRVVFDTLTQRGEDVEFLIAQKQEEGMDYDDASREVVAEAMTDILPDAAFVETLANEHKTIFQKLLDKLKEFTAKVREYFASIGTNRSREANALKEQVGDTVKYLERIVNLFDSVAVEAVHNYQMTVAAEEVDISEVERAGSDNATEDGDNVTESDDNAAATPEEMDSVDLVAEEATESPAEETAIPPNEETEEAKQELQKAVRMPIRGTNMEALLEGIKNGELSMESITLSGSVEGFNSEQRQHLVDKLLEGVYTDAETIRIDVPYDGKFEIVNTPGNVAKVLENLKVKVRQEAIFDKKTVSLLTSNGDVRIVDLDGKKYLSNSYVMLPATDAAVEYAKAELKGRENQLHPEVAKAFENADNPLPDAPTEAKLDKTTVLIFNVDGKKLFFDKRLFAPLDGGKLYYADIRGTGILKSVDTSGNVMGYLMGIRPSGKTEITGEKPSNLKSYARKKVREAAVQKEKPASKPKSEPKTKAHPKVMEAKATKPATVESSVKLEDFGEKIGGARKDQWSKRGLLTEDLAEMNDREREKNVKKDNVWKRPDYRKLIEGGADRNILYVRNEIRKALNQNIAYPYRVSDARKQQMQEEFVATVRTIQEMAEKVTTKAELAAMGRPWLIEHGYRTENSFTEKWRRNAALQGTNYAQTIEHLVRNWDQLGKLADKANFAVDAEKKIPSGFSIHEDDSNHTWFIARGNLVVRHSIHSYEEALSYLQNAASKTKKKTRFVPEQLLEVHRKGPNYRGGKDVKGQDYLDTFGFKGGEFGNWMTEKDRRVSMNYGFDALKDLADALGIADMDISLAGNLSIAFGARGQGLSGAAAHYEQERHVINLTKMNGAGSLAHEWFHALDDFLGGYGSKFATEYGSQLPETTKAAVRHLLTTMQYRDATQEETDMAATKAYEQARRSVTYQVANQFGWVRRIEEGKFQESDARYYSRKPTEADVKKYHELLDKLLETGDMAVLEELSALRKEVAGHVIPKEDRESIGFRLLSLRPDVTKNVQKMRLRSDFYNNSRRFGELHHKDGDYWDSTIEMAARAFACYVTDKTGKHNDYLSAHSDTAVTLDMDKDGNVSVVRAFPVGEERVQINAAFDQLIAALKADGFLQEQGETVKPEMIQYQRRSNSEDVQNPYDGKSLYGDEEIYRYDFMTAQPDMTVVELPSLSGVKTGKKVDQKKAVELGLANAMDLGRQVGENQFAIRNVYTGREIIVGTSGLSHGLSGENVNRLRTNARLAAIGGTIVQNAIPVNGLKNKNRQASGTYAMACLLNSGDYHVVAIVTVEEHTSKTVGIDYVDITHSINGRILAKNIDSRSSTREMGYGQESAPTTAIYKISIADLLDIVNKTHKSILSDDVLKFFNEERPDGGFYSDKVLHQKRTSPLTDRDVLAMAVDDVPVDGLTDGEKGALRIFKSRLNTLQTLQEERAELGRIYREQQFGTKVDRAAAEQTRNRMKVLDDQIEKAKAEVLSIEDKQVLNRVLQKARKVVEKQQWIKDEEKLKRWRDRRNNADAVKKYRERLTKDVNDLTNWVLHPNNKDVVKHIPDVLKNSVIPFLSSIDFTSKRQLRGGAATKADQEFIKRLNGLKAALKPNQSVDGLYGDYSDLPPNFMERLQLLIDSAQAIVDRNSGEFVVNQMTSEELRELSQVVRNLKEFIKNFNKFHVNAMFQHVHEAGDNTIGDLAQMGNASDKTGTVSNFVFWQQIRPAYAFERFGKGGEAIYDGLRRGQATLAFNTKIIQEFAEKAYTAKEVKAWEEQIKSINLGGDIVKMPVSTIMSFYELSKRPQALGHILGGGIRVATFTAKGKKISDIGHTITLGDVQNIIGTLTDRQKEVADTLQKFMQEQGGKWGNYVSVKRFGEELFGEEHYFPINSDGRHLAANADEHPSAASLYALLNMGFTKAVQEGANNRVVLYSIFDVFANHMSSIAQYNAFALPVVDAIKWFNYQQKSEPDEDGKRIVLGSVRDQMDRVYGVPEETRPGSGRQGYAQSFVINILRAFNGTEAQGVPTDSTGLNALRQYNMAQVAFNFRVVVQQPMAITRAALLVGYGSIIKGMKLNPSAIAQNIREMQRYSGIAAWKSLGFYDVNISRGLTDIIKHNSTVRDKINEVGMWGAEKADILTWAGIWSACKEEVMKKLRIRPKDEGFYEAVTKLFEDVVYKTQVVDSVLTKNEYLRSKGFFARAIGSFMSEPTTTASMLVDAYDKYHADMQRGLNRQQAWKKNSRMIVRTAYVYGVSAVILAAVQAVADAFRDDDDYQEFLEKWLEAFGGNLVDELMPLNKLPILSDFYEVAKELLSIVGVDTYGNAPTSVFMQWYDSLIKGMEILYDKISGEDTSYTWYGGAYKLLQAASGMTGLPMAAATREIVTAWNNSVGAMAPSLKIKTYDSGEKNEIKYAYQDGYLTDEEASAELLEKGLVDNKDEAYWTIQGWEAGEGYSRYDAIFDAVRNGGDFNTAMRELTSHGYTEKEIIGQVKSQIGKWYKEGQITKLQATDMLTKYSGMDGEDITATVNKWSSKVVTGIAFEDIKDEYVGGNITAARAIEMYVRYGGYTQDKATEMVTKWRAEKETGIVYDDIDEEFMDGEISEGDARNMYITYGGYSEKDAAEKVTVLAFVKKNPECEGISYAAIENYQTNCLAFGVPAATFYDVWKYNSDTKANLDANGDRISGSKKVKVLAYINRLDLTNAQKDSLYYAFGWAESKIDEAPWH